MFYLQTAAAENPSDLQHLSTEAILASPVLLIFAEIGRHLAFLGIRLFLSPALLFIIIFWGEECHISDAPVVDVHLKHGH